MYINTIIYKTANPLGLKKIPIGNRFKTYLKDLYHRYGRDQNLDMNKNIFSYPEMGEILLKTILKRNRKLLPIDIIFFPLWGMTFNMEYAVPELYWKEIFNLNGKLIDVRDCGLLCVYYAIYLMLTLNRSGDLNSAMICSIENECVLKTDKIIAPQISYIGSLVCSSDKNPRASLKVIDCEIVNHLMPENLNKRIENALIKYMQKFEFDVSECQIFVNAATTHIKLSLIGQMFFHPMSSGFLYFCINTITKNKKKYPDTYFFIIDFDSSRQSAGILFLKRGVC